LIGFNLTETLLLKLFSDLDPHKKGHLTEIDWLNAFSSYSWKNQMQNELQSTVASSFSCPREAFRFFLRNNKNPVDKVISFQAFQQSINSLLPKRHSKEMIKLFWNDCSRNKQSINFSEFCMHFDNQPFTAQST